MNQNARRFLILLVLLSPAAWSSTYVGNGGTSEDLDLKETLTQIEEGLLNAQSTLPNRLCRCDSDGKICGPLDQISGLQADECAKFLIHQGPLLVDLIRTQKVRWSWTDQDMKVQEGDSSRSVDAVADERTMTITIHRGRFSNLPASGRQFLIAHELMHLLPWDSKFIKDTDSVGSFKGRTGGRDLINAAAAAATNSVPTKSMPQITSSQSAPKGPFFELTHWLELDALGSSTSIESDLISLGRSTGSSFKYRHQLGKVNAQVYYNRMTAKGTALSTITLEQEQRGYGLGLGYRWQLGSNVESYRGRSHILVSAHLEHLTSMMSINDTLIGEKAGARSTALGGSIKLMLPVSDDFWFSLETKSVPHRLSHRFEQAEISLKTVNGLSSTNVGVSYAF